MTNVLSVSFEYLGYSVSHLNVRTEGKIKFIADTYKEPSLSERLSTVDLLVQTSLAQFLLALQT
jgi:hypothetical protein